jgi:translocation and assembly module TamA
MARYDPQMVQRLVRLAGLTPGTDYDLARVLDAQRRLAESGYFESVFVMVEPGDDPDHAPVQIKVREVLAQKLVVGVGGSTDSGARLSLEHTHHSVPGLHWRAVTGLTWSRNNQSAQASLTSPVDDAGWRWLVSGLYNRQQDASGITVSQRVRWGQTQDTTAISRTLFLQYDRARTFEEGLQTEGQASISANFGWTLRRLDHVLFPEKGYSVALEAGSGLTLEQTRRVYLRGRARALSYLPLGAAEEGRLALRGEWGTVWARGEVPVPSTELFLSGGDNTVRGYALRSLGVLQADGSVNPGRVLGVGSVEWQRPWLVQSQRSAWEQTFFVDVGAVADRAQALTAKVGVGAGVRYRSPVGPLQLDLAYGVATHRLRLHMTLGFRF